MKRLSCAVLLSLCMLANTPVQALEVMYWCTGGMGDISQDYLGTIPNMKEALTSVSLQWYWSDAKGGIFGFSSDRDAQTVLNYYHPHGIKVFMCVTDQNLIEGTWDWYGYAKPSYSTHRETFINTLVNECLRLGFDGVDIDYEGDGDSVQYERYEFSEFLRELHDRLKEHDKELAVCFYSSPCWGAPNMAWFPEMVGAIDHARLMGYTSDWETNDVSVYGPICTGLTFDNNPEAEGENFFYKYSFKSDWALQCGFDSTILSIGLEGETSDTWGDGGDCRQHIQEILDLGSPAGVCIWSFNLPGKWKEGETWALLKQLKEIERTHYNNDATPTAQTGKAMAKPLSGISIAKDGLHVNFEAAGRYSVNLYNAAGRCVLQTGNKFFDKGSHLIFNRSGIDASGIYLVKLNGEGQSITQKIGLN